MRIKTLIGYFIQTINENYRKCYSPRIKLNICRIKNINHFRKHVKKMEVIRLFPKLCNVLSIAQNFISAQKKTSWRLFFLYYSRFSFERMQKFPLLNKRQVCRKILIDRINQISNQLHIYYIQI